MALNDILPYEYFENYFTYIIAIRLLTENNIILNMMEKTEFENNEYIFFKRENVKSYYCIKRLIYLIFSNSVFFIRFKIKFAIK